MGEEKAKVGESPAAAGLEALLQPMRSEGHMVSSDASFTLSLDSLIERYALFERETAGYFLLRLMQGLYALRASAVEIRTAKNDVYILVNSFESEAPVWLEPERLREALTQFHTWNRPMHHICAAFLSVAGAPGVELAWGWQGKALVASDGTFDVHPEVEPHSNLVVRVKKPSSLLFTTTAPEHALLASRLRFRSIRVTLDKLPLVYNIPAADRSKNCWYRDVSDAFHLGMVRWGEPTPDDWDADFGAGKPGSHTAAFVWYADPKARSAALVVDASLQGAGILTPVIDGVAGKSLELPQAPGMTLFVDASDLKTDLSGLGLIEADRLLADYLSTYRALLTRIRPRVDELTALWTSGYPDYYLAKGVGGLAQFAGEGIILLLPLAAALGAAEILASRAAYAVRKSHRTASLRAGLGERIDAILSQAPRP